MWNKERIQQLLATNDKAVARAVVAIYNFQTADEQSVGTTKYHNSVGFNSIDAKRGQYYAGYISSAGRLTGRHLDIARKMMMKYHRQLCEIANAGMSVPQAIEPDAGNLAEEQMVMDEIRWDKEIQARDAAYEARRMRRKFEREESIVW